jgi:hypothetical protein
MMSRSFGWLEEFHRFPVHHIPSSLFYASTTVL